MTVNINEVIAKMQSQMENFSYVSDNNIYRLNSLGINEDMTNGLSFSISKNDNEYAINVYICNSDETGDIYNVEIHYEEKASDEENVYLLNNDSITHETNVDVFVDMIFKTLLIDIINEVNVCAI